MSEHRYIFDDSLAAPGFLKTGDQPALDSSQRVALIRKGNELFNAGKYDQAKRVFLTTRYTDGLIRLGDYYYNQKQTLEAFRMYWLAPDRGKSEHMIERMALVVRGWLTQDREEEG